MLNTYIHQYTVMSFFIAKIKFTARALDGMARCFHNFTAGTMDGTSTSTMQLRLLIKLI